ncbi:MAG: hypothetical protein REH79_01145 [Spiroplasma sp.]|nr:hypothetical protein [Spiroplasma sp.]
MKANKKLVPIKIKKLNIRGDEIAILFFSLLLLIFLFISFFRLFAVGKLFDDFIFLFLFGWSKYLVYFTLIGLTIPICFNYYFKFKLSFILAVIISLIAISWLVSNINLILVNDQRIFLSFSPYNFNSLGDYFNEWWSKTIINNYRGFFAQPISFTDWTNITSFFPSYAAGGIISNFLIFITNYGSFITNLVFNFLLLIISFTWVFFNKPWFFLTLIFFFLKPLIKYFRKQKIEKINQKSFQQEQMAIKKSELTNNQELNQTKAPEIKVTEVKIEPTINPKTNHQQLLVQNVLKESGTLTPFGQVNKSINQDSTQKFDLTNNDQPDLDNN